jgi:hypothetical protein
MNTQDYKERKITIEGWPVNVTSYKLGDQYYCKIDNVSPGAWLARTQAATREEAEAAALEKAKHLLAKTRRQSV